MLFYIQPAKRTLQINIVYETINNSNMPHEATDYLFNYCGCSAKIVVLR